MRKKCLQPGRKLQHFFTFYFFWVEIECIDTIRWNAVWIARGFKVTLCSTFVVGGHLTFKRVIWTIWTILERSNKCQVYICCWHFLLTKLCKVLTKIEKHGCKMIELTGSLIDPVFRDDNCIHFPSAKDWDLQTGVPLNSFTQQNRGHQGHHHSCLFLWLPDFHGIFHWSNRIFMGSWNKSRQKHLAIVEVQEFVKCDSRVKGQAFGWKGWGTWCSLNH